MRTLCGIGFLLGMFLACGACEIKIAIVGVIVMAAFGILIGAFEQKKKPRVGRR